MAILRKPHIQVLLAITLAIAFGLLFPRAAVQFKPLGDAFIALLRMLLAPLIFCAVVLGLTHVRNMSQLGRLAVKSLVYFEVLTTLAMVIAFAVANLVKPGAGVHVAALGASPEVATATGAASTSF